jgi:hypothetical protein
MVLKTRVKALQADFDKARLPWVSSCCGRAFSVVEEPSALWKSLQRCGRAFSVVEEPSALWKSLQRSTEPSVSKARDLGERLFINAPKS